jgi:hypothetical protein
MHKIACIRFSYNARYYSDEPTAGLLPAVITEWTEVDDETYNFLMENAGKFSEPDYVVVELLPEEFIPNTVSDLKVEIQRLHEEAEKERQAEEAQRLEKIAKRQQKRLAKESNRIAELEREIELLKGK